MQKLENYKIKDTHLTFEQLGVDFMFVDEAHLYKKLVHLYEMSGVAGVNTTSSQRASDMLAKVQYLQEEHKGRGVVFATGTPISNSMSELFTMMRFLEPDVLDTINTPSFDEWASTFGEVVTSLEVTPEGTSYQMKSRFAKFHNLPELMSAFALVADIQTEDMLLLPVPKLKDNKMNVITSQMTESQEEKMLEFADRADVIRGGGIDPSEDNMLKLTNEARLMAIDMRMLDESYEAHDSSKIILCCEKVVSIYHETTDKKSTQIIFSDVGTPKKDKFNVYDEVKRQLIELGLPKETIAFVHDAKNEHQREELFEKVRSGQIRVILGSTGKLGTGTNIQDKLIAAHHLDCPWRPSDMTQRDGRIIRPGNENSEVQIYNYITKGTFDAFLWQTQEQKLGYIKQVMTGKNISRSMTDIDPTLLTAGQMKAQATKNPLFVEKMEVDNEIRTLEVVKNSWYEQQLFLQQQLTNTYPTIIKENNRLIEKVKEDIILSQHHTGEFSIRIENQDIDERTVAGDLMNQLIATLKPTTTSRLELGEYKGFKMFAAGNSLATYIVTLQGVTDHRIDVTLSSGLGTIRRIENLVDHLPVQLNELADLIRETERLLEKTSQEVGTPFEEESRLLTLLERQSVINQSIEHPEEESEPEQVKEEVHSSVPQTSPPSKATSKNNGLER